MLYRIAVQCNREQSKLMPMQQYWSHHSACQNFTDLHLLGQRCCIAALLPLHCTLALHRLQSLVAGLCTDDWIGRLDVCQGSDYAGCERHHEQ
jgi:hypothetical protein